MSRSKGSGRKHAWETALDDTPTTDIEGIGTVRVENGPLGERKFIWVRNEQSGGASAGDVMMYGLTWGGLTISVIDGSNSALTIVASSSKNFVQSTIGTDAGANAFVDDFVYITSNGSNAGALPQGEFRKIKSNTTNRFFLATALTAAAITLDNFVIVRPYTVIDATSAANDTPGKVAGVCMADAAVHDFMWLQTKGIHPEVSVDTAEMGTSRVGGTPVIVGPDAGEVTSILSADAASILALAPKPVGWIFSSVAGDLASLKVPVMLDIS